MMSRLIKIFFIIGATVIMVFASPPNKALSKENRATSKGKKVEKVLRIKDVEIKGEVKKPQAVFFLPRSKFTMEDMIVTETFIDKITDVVDKE